jgi:hypothetical protein
MRWKDKPECRSKNTPQAYQRCSNRGVTWGISTVGSAPALQAGSQEFESPILHLRIANIQQT